MIRRSKYHTLAAAAWKYFKPCGALSCFKGVKQGIVCAHQSLYYFNHDYEMNIVMSLYCCCFINIAYYLYRNTETASVCECVCLSVASHISETSQAIAIAFDNVTALVTRMHHF